MATKRYTIVEFIAYALTRGIRIKDISRRHVCLKNDNIQRAPELNQLQDTIHRDEQLAESFREIANRFATNSSVSVPPTNNAYQHNLSGVETQAQQLRSNRSQPLGSGDMSFWPTTPAQYQQRLRTRTANYALMDFSLLRTPGRIDAIGGRTVIEQVARGRLTAAAAIYADVAACHLDDAQTLMEQHWTECRVAAYCAPNPLAVLARRRHLPWFSLGFKLRNSTETIASTIAFTLRSPGHAASLGLLKIRLIDAIEYVASLHVAAARSYVNDWYMDWITVVRESRPGYPIPT